jgi:hypothetical protein
MDRTSLLGPFSLMARLPKLGLHTYDLQLHAHVPNISWTTKGCSNMVKQKARIKSVIEKDPKRATVYQNYKQGQIVSSKVVHAEPRQIHKTCMPSKQLYSHHT